MKIVFIGMMGSGKSVIGSKVAKLLNLDFIDTDNYIEQRYGKIADIFASLGEEEFRKIEKQCVKEIAAFDNAVISTGGGVVLNGQNMQELSGGAVVVFLQASPQTIFERVKNSNRPLLKSGGIERVKEILAKRYPLYEKYANFTVVTDNLTIEQCAEKVLQLLK